MDDMLDGDVGRVPPLFYMSSIGIFYHDLHRTAFLPFDKYGVDLCMLGLNNPYYLQVMSLHIYGVILQS